MKVYIILNMLIVLLIGCNDNNKRNSKIMTNTVSQNLSSDSTIYRYAISDEIAGSAYRKKGIGYAVVVGMDTSDFNCIITESKEGKVNINLKIPYIKKSSTHSERIKELKLILNKANTDFNFDSLKYIGLGRLILNGDLAVEITNEYIKRFGTNSKLMDFKTMKQFFIDSRLGYDLNNVFKPYSIKVTDVSLEKLFFTTKKDLYWASKIEMDSTLVPDKILDCITWVELKKE